MSELADAGMDAREDIEAIIAGMEKGSQRRYRLERLLRAIEDADSDGEDWDDE